jgi:hypothetical protein
MGYSYKRPVNRGVVVGYKFVDFQGTTSVEGFANTSMEKLPIILKHISCNHGVADLQSNMISRGPLLLVITSQRIVVLALIIESHSYTISNAFRNALNNYPDASP